MKLAIFFSLFFTFSPKTTAMIDLTGIDCIELDKPFAGFENCRFEAVSKTYKYIDVKVNLHQIPFSNVTIYISIMRNANGYKPFLLNATIDSCKFLKNRKKGIALYFFSFIKDHSNMNHSCPYNHDLILRKLDTTFLNNGLIKILPLLDGDYALYTSWSVYDKPRVKVNFYFSFRST